MTALALIPFVAAGCMARAAGAIVRRMPPAGATRLLTVVALSTSLCCGYVGSLAAFGLLARIPQVAAAGGWSRKVLDAGGIPVPPVAGLVPAVLVAVLLFSGLSRFGRHLWALAKAHEACRDVPRGHDEVVVVDDPTPRACAVAGFPGRILVSTGMLAALSPTEQQALLAHERSHLRHRHHLYVQITDIAAAANPLLRPVTRAVVLATERWADEDAAAATDRVTTARALARAGLAGRVSPSPGPVAAGTGGDVVARARALQAPAPRPDRALSLALALAVLVVVSATAMESRTTEKCFERAAVAYLHLTAHHHH